MYCPDCGKENPSGQKFCRSCGLSLKPISQALAGEPLSGPEEGQSLIIKGEPTFWQNPLVYGLLVMVLGAIVGAVGDKVVRSQTVRDIGTILALLGIGLIGLKGVMLVLAQHHYVNPSKHTSHSPGSSAFTPALLSSQPPSVTESTTRQLDLSKRTGDHSHDTQPTS